MTTAFEDRLWSGAVEDENGCFVWQRATTSGYGRIKRPGGRSGMMPAHRAAYELRVGPIPPGMVIDHLCRNRACINPEHLEVVTNRENILRGVSSAAQRARKTHCPKGHPYDEANTYIRPTTGNRECRSCRYLSVKATRERAEDRRALSPSTEATPIEED